MGEEAFIDAMQEMMRYKPEDDAGSITKAYTLDPDGDLSVLSSAKHLIIEMDMEAEGTPLDFTYGRLLSETLYSMPIKAVKIHNSPETPMKEGLQPLPNAAAASDAAVVVCMKSCGFPEERSDEEGDEDDEEEGEGEIKLVDASKKMTAGESRKVVARLERAAARIERRPEDEQVAQLAAFKEEKKAAVTAVIDGWHEGRLKHLKEKAPSVFKLMAALKASTSIETVYIRVFEEDGCNSFSLDEVFMIPAFAQVISCWAFHPTLSSLDVSHCNLGGFGSFVLATLVLKNENLTRFDTSNGYKPRMGLSRGVFEGGALKEVRAAIASALTEGIGCEEGESVLDLLQPPKA